jgi:hypothetical protein
MVRISLSRASSALLAWDDPLRDPPARVAAAALALSRALSLYAASNRPSAEPSGGRRAAATAAAVAAIASSSRAASSHGLPAVFVGRAPEASFGSLARAGALLAGAAAFVWLTGGGSSERGAAEVARPSPAGRLLPATELLATVLSGGGGIEPGAQFSGSSAQQATSSRADDSSGDGNSDGDPPVVAAACHAREAAAPLLRTADETGGGSGCWAFDAGAAPIRCASKGSASAT